MRLLIIGGTVFLGRHLAEQALQRGHAVTLFNRGQSNPALFPAAEHLTGDRAGDVSALAGRTWDAVIDTGGYHPREVRRTVQALKTQVGHYQFVSTLSVYADDAPAGATENSPVATLDGEVEAAVISSETYGPLKALCEQEVLQAMPAHGLVVRPGLIVGPYDRSDRFTYWPVRIQAGGDVLAPGDIDAPVQFIHAGDLAAWMLDCTEQGVTGVFNATGPDYALTLGEVFDACRVVAPSAARLVWVNEDFLLAHAVAPYTEMPLWVPSAYVGFNRVDCSKAIAQGLCFRPLLDVISDTLEWHATRPAATTLRAGLSAAREAELLAAWRHEGHR
ncbi:MAG: NAD-dependent epimerase/dehydratase family protein [Anaerolineales bacterium]|nr:NAD-dependent epimerase/dehydratase family protein [Anaerolineales bacterium]